MARSRLDTTIYATILLAPMLTAVAYIAMTPGKRASWSAFSAGNDNGAPSFRRSVTVVGLGVRESPGKFCRLRDCVLGLVAPSEIAQ